MDSVIERKVKSSADDAPNAAEPNGIGAGERFDLAQHVVEHDEGRAESVPWEQVRAELFGKRS